jgi:L-threonylcarbamoyladenylate synthase
MINTKIFKVAHPDDQQLKEAADILKANGTLAFPTESVYGLGANVFSEEAVNKIYIAKGRPSDNPLISHIYHKEQLKELVKSVSPKGQQLMDAFWPGPLTLIFESKGTVAKNMTGGLDTIAIRMPSHPIALKILELAGLPIAAPSANLSGKPSPTIGDHVVEDLSGRVDGIVIESQSEFGIESTILDLTEEPPMLLRPGGITVEDIETVIGKIQLDPALEKKMADHVQPKAPGMKYTHYSPEADVTIVAGDALEVVKKINELTASTTLKVGVMCTHETMHLYNAETVLSLGSRTHYQDVASNLFVTLRQFDALGVDIVYAEGYDTLGMGKAIMNRLLKAAGYQVINV